MGINERSTGYGVPSPVGQSGKVPQSDGSQYLLVTPSSATYTTVANYAALPAAASQTGMIYVVLNGTGIYLINRKEAGLYYSNGSTWTRLGDIPSFFSDANFQVYNATDNTKLVKLDTSGITTGTTRTLTVPNASGTIALTSQLPTLPTFPTGTIVGTTDTQTLSNKTLSGASNTFSNIPANAITISLNNQTGTSYTLQASDHGKTITCNNASAITVTAPDLFIGFTCEIIQLGAGKVTLVASSTTLNARTGWLSTSGQHAALRVFQYATAIYNVSGDAGP